MGRAPAFQFYPKDWMDFKVQRLSLQAMGAYINLLAYMWKDSEDQCSIPDNPRFIAKVLTISTRRWKKIREELQHPDAQLLIEKDGRLISARLAEEAQKQVEYRLGQSEAGKAGAEKRWQAQRGCHSDPISNPIVSPMAKNSSSSASSSSSLKTLSESADDSDSASFRAMVFTAWSDADIIRHRSISAVRGLVTTLDAAAKRRSASETVAAIKNYSAVLKSPAHYFKHKWTLKAFLERGLDQFCDEADPLNNFRREFSPHTKSGAEPQAARINTSGFQRPEAL